MVSKKSHNAINIISGISILGICIGTMALVIVLSAFNGLSDLVKSLYNSFDPDINITLHEGKTFSANTPEFQKLKKAFFISYYTEVLEDNALLKSNNQQCLATIKGVSAEYEKMTDFDTLIREGHFELQQNQQSFIIPGKGISYQLNINGNDSYTPVSIYAPTRGIHSSLDPEDAFNKKITYVSGVFSINDDFDYQYVLAPLAFTQELFGYNDEISSVELSLKKGTNPKIDQAEIEKIVGDKYDVKNRDQQNELLFKTLKSEKLWTFMILVFILIVATFNVIGSLTMLILEKKKDISILWNMGANVKTIRSIFLIEGILITFIGAISGILLGVLICWLQLHFKLIRFDQGYVVDAYPVSIQLMDIAKILGIVMIIGFFAAWYPVRIFTKKYLEKGS